MASEGQAKVSLLLELKNRMSTSLTRAKENVNSSVAHMKGQFNDLKIKHAAAFTAMKDEVPGLGRALDLLGNPYVLITAGALAIVGILGLATNEAGKFNHAFLPIKQLNLDKSTKTMDAYKKSIYDVAMQTGQAGTDTAKAFYDIQSATGLFGKDVADITRKVGNYSIATGAEMPDAVNQTTKAMKAFGLGVKDIDALLISNAKTVQLGIVTFDELAKVQTTYGGAAAGAGQNVDTANKIFAAFTSIAKGAEEAATLAKGAFDGFTQPQTISGLKSIGISMYDAKGNMRDMGSILKDVSGKFKNMNPAEIDALINKIGGPEGLRALFVKIKTGAGDFFKLMDDYDSSKFNLDDALKNAKGDFETLKKIVGNQFNTVMAQLGEKILPTVAKFLGKASEWLQKIYNNWDSILPLITTTAVLIGTVVTVWKLWTVAQWAMNFAMTANPIGLIITGIALLISYITMAIIYYDEFGAAMLLLFMPIVNVIMSFKKHWSEITDAFTNGGIIAGIKKIGAVLLDALLYPVQQLLELLSKIPGMGKLAGSGAAWIKDFRSKTLGLDISKETKDKVNPLSSETTTTTEKKKKEDDKLDPNKPTNPANDLANKATQTKNLTINIDSFVKGGINTEHTNLQNMDESQLEQWMTNMFMRVIRNAEMNY